jgi:hypothetical protein
MDTNNEIEQAPESSKTTRVWIVVSDGEVKATNLTKGQAAKLASKADGSYIAKAY